MLMVVVVCVLWGGGGAEREGKMELLNRLFAAGYIGSNKNDLT